MADLARPERRLPPISVQARAERMARWEHLERVWVLPPKPGHVAWTFWRVQPHTPGWVLFQGQWYFEQVHWPQNTTVGNRETDRPQPGDIYVGRPTKWGNPFRIGPDGDRATVIAKFRTWIMEQPELLTQVSELRSHRLMCWCAPLPCHADVLAKLVNR